MINQRRGCDVRQNKKIPKRYTNPQTLALCSAESDSSIVSVLVFCLCCSLFARPTFCRQAHQHSIHRFSKVVQYRRAFHRFPWNIEAWLFEIWMVNQFKIDPQKFSEDFTCFSDREAFAENQQYLWFVFHFVCHSFKCFQNNRAMVKSQCILTDRLSRD